MISFQISSQQFFGWNAFNFHCRLCYYVLKLVPPQFLLGHTLLDYNRYACRQEVWSTSSNRREMSSGLEYKKVRRSCKSALKSWVTQSSYWLAVVVNLRHYKPMSRSLRSFGKWRRYKDQARHFNRLNSTFVVEWLWRINVFLNVKSYLTILKSERCKDLNYLWLWHSQDIDRKNLQTAAILKRQADQIIELQSLYKEEQILRKRYFNMMEGMSSFVVCFGLFLSLKFAFHFLLLLTYPFSFSSIRFPYLSYLHVCKRSFRFFMFTLCFSTSLFWAVSSSSCYHLWTWLTLTGYQLILIFVYSQIWRVR